jgi:hypothetical protein
MTLYRLRIYTSPGRRLVRVHPIKAPTLREALEKTRTVVDQPRYRHGNSIMRTSWALDELCAHPIEWRTVGMS